MGIYIRDRRPYAVPLFAEKSRFSKAYVPLHDAGRLGCMSEPNGIIYYRRGVGCTDAIFATQETIAKHVREGSAVHMCLYDLQKAFGSVEFPMLLDHLFSIGKTWRIINSWYEGGSCCVKVEDRLSNAFPVQRGVRQGSVLSPTLFLLVMDPLLKKLETASLGLKINDLYKE